MFSYEESYSHPQQSSMAKFRGKYGVEILRMTNMSKKRIPDSR
jgi:hypothetical protein